MGMFCIVKWLINSYSVEKNHNNKKRKKRLLKKEKKKIKQQHKHTQRKGLLWGSQDFMVTCTVWQCLHVRTLQYQSICMLASRLLPLPLVQCACVCRRQGGAAKQAKPQPTKGTHPAYVYVAIFLRVWKYRRLGTKEIRIKAWIGLAFYVLVSCPVVCSTNVVLFVFILPI